MDPESQDKISLFFQAYIRMALKLLRPIVSRTSVQELNLLKIELRKARIGIGVYEYVASAILSALLSGVLFFLFFHAIAFHPLDMLEAYSILLRNFIFSSLVSIFLLAVSYMYPYYVSDVREADINSKLIFSLNYIVGMLRAGASFEETMAGISKLKEFGEFSYEAEKFSRYIEEPGVTTSGAIRKVSDECPSDKLQNLFYNLSMTLFEGLQAKPFLEEQLKTCLEDYKRQEQEKTTRIQTLTHTYLVLLILIPSMLMLVLVALTMDPMLSSIVNQYQFFSISPVFLLLMDILYLSYLEFKEPEI